MLVRASSGSGGGGGNVKYESIDDMGLNVVHSYHTRNAAVVVGGNNTGGGCLYNVWLKDGVFEKNITTDAGAYAEVRYDSTTEILTAKFVNSSYALRGLTIMYDEL